MKKKEEVTTKKTKEVEKRKSSSKTEQEVNEKKTVFTKDKKIKIIIGACLGAIIIIIGLIVLLSALNKPSDTHYLADKFIDNYRDILSLKNDEKIFIKDEGIDPVYDYSYVEAATIYFSTEEKNNPDDIQSELSIAKYNSPFEAQEKVKFLKNIYIKSHEKLDNTFIVEFDTYKEIFKDENSYIFSINNYVININEKYKSNFKKIEKYLSEEINNLNQVTDNNIKKDKVEKYWNEKLQNLVNNYDTQYEKNIGIVKDLINEQTKKLDNCHTDYCIDYYNEIINLEKYEEFTEEMNKFKEKYNEIMVTIPDFSTVSYNDASNWCNQNMSGCKISQEYSSTIPNGSFISQSLEKGKMTKKVNELKLVYSKGPEPSMEFKNALKKAHNYLSVMAFSYSGLVKQLEFEGYSHEASVWAVDNCGANWNEQAAKKAKNYLDVMAFSRQGLISQLEFEGFTYEQAVYGVTQVGY